MIDLTLINTPAAKALRNDLQRLLEAHAGGGRPSQEMVATMAFATGHLFFAMPDGDLAQEDLQLFLPTLLDAGVRHAAESVVMAHGGRQ